VIDGGADRLREAAVVEGRRDCALILSDEFMTNRVQLSGSYPGLDVLTDHIQDIGCQATGNTHFVLLFRRFDAYFH
jgi:hypothetical protein